LLLIAGRPVPCSATRYTPPSTAGVGHTLPHIPRSNCMFHAHALHPGMVTPGNLCRGRSTRRRSTWRRRRRRRLAAPPRSATPTATAPPPPAPAPAASRPRPARPATAPAAGRKYRFKLSRINFEHKISRYIVSKYISAHVQHAPPPPQPLVSPRRQPPQQHGSGAGPGQSCGPTAKYDKLL
jgi:hypothetical protein